MIDNKGLKKLIVPLIFEQLLAVSVGMVDTLMVSTVGEVAVSVLKSFSIASLPVSRLVLRCLMRYAVRVMRTLLCL